MLEDGVRGKCVTVRVLGLVPEVWHCSRPPSHLSPSPAADQGLPPGGVAHWRNDSLEQLSGRHLFYHA